MLLKHQNDITYHGECYKTYTRKSGIKSYIKQQQKACNSGSTAAADDPPVLRSLVSTFNTNTHCIFCTNQITLSKKSFDEQKSMDCFVECQTLALINKIRTSCEVKTDELRVNCAGYV